MTCSFASVVGVVGFVALFKTMVRLRLVTQNTIGRAPIVVRGLASEGRAGLDMTSGHVGSNMWLV